MSVLNVQTNDKQYIIVFLSLIERFGGFSFKNKRALEFALFQNNTTSRSFFYFVKLFL